MTSCLLPLFFLFSLCASIPTEPTERPGLKVRVTERGLDVVKDFVIAIFKALKDQPFPPIQFPIIHPKTGIAVEVTINELTFTKLDANKENLVLTLKEGTGSLLIEIKDVPFHVHLKRKANDPLFNYFTIHYAETDVTGDGADGGLNLMMDLQLKRTEEGKLEVTMLECDAGKITIKTNSFPGSVYDKFATPYLKLCDYLMKEVLLPKVNSMLKELPMKLPMVEELKLTMDYSIVSQDITVTPSGLNLPLKGLVYLEGKEGQVTANTEGAVLDLGTDNKEMLYLGISDFFLNSFAASLYEGGAMTKTLEKMDNGYLKAWRNLKHPSQWQEDINGEIRITEVPIIHIKPEGICVEPKGQFRAFSGEEKDFQTFSVECDIAVKVEVKGGNLIAPLEEIKCKLVTGPITAEKWLTNFIEDNLEGALKDGVKIPLPPGITVVQGSPVNYHDGFMVLAGSLDWPEEAMKTLAETIRDDCFRKLGKEAVGGAGATLG